MESIAKIEYEIQKHIYEIERTNKLYNSEISKRSSDQSDEEKRKSDNYLKYLTRLKAYRENRIKELKMEIAREIAELEQRVKSTEETNVAINLVDQLDHIIQKKGDRFLIDYDVLYELTNQNSNFINRLKEWLGREDSHIKNVKLFNSETGVGMAIEHHEQITLLHCTIDQQATIYETTEKKIFVSQMSKLL